MGKKGVRVRRRRRRRLRQQEVKGPKATNAHLAGSAFKELAREEGGGVSLEGGVAGPRMFDDECTR